MSARCGAFAGGLFKDCAVIVKPLLVRSDPELVKVRVDATKQYGTY